MVIQKPYQPCYKFIETTSTPHMVNNICFVHEAHPICTIKGKVKNLNQPYIYSNKPTKSKNCVKKVSNLSKAHSEKVGTLFSSEIDSSILLKVLLLRFLTKRSTSNQRHHKPSFIPSLLHSSTSKRMEEIHSYLWRNPNHSKHVKYPRPKGL